MKLKRITALILTALLLLAFPSALLSCADRSPTALELGDEKVSYNLLRYFVKNYMGSLTAADYEKDEALQKELTENVFSALRQLAACRMVAEEQEIELSDDEEEALDTQIENLKASYKTEEEYEETVKATFGDEQTLREILELNALQQKLYTYLTDEFHGIFKSDDPTVRADIEAGNFFAAEYLFIYCTDSDRTEKAEFAASIHTRVANGESLAAIDREYETEYALKMDYCDLPCFTYTEELPYFEKAVLALSEGELADVIERSNGFLIVRRNALDSEYIDENFMSVVSSYLTREYNYYMENCADGLELEWKSKYEDMKLWEIE